MPSFVTKGSPVNAPSDTVSLKSVVVSVNVHSTFLQSGTATKVGAAVAFDSPVTREIWKTLPAWYRS